MKLKLDDKGAVVVQDGKPVYVHDDGKEVAFDAPAAMAKIGQLNGESKTHREAKEAAETQLAAFKDITDPAAAVRALQTVKNLDDKKLVDSGKVEEIKAEAIKAVEEKYKPIVAERDTLKSDLHKEKIGGSFSRSKFITDKLVIPADLVEARFGGNFEIKDGKVLAKDQAGNPVYSRARPGELADFDEALETLVDAYPQKAQILKGSGGGGSGAPSKGGSPGSKTIARKDFDALDPVARSVKMKDGFQVVDNP
jgi:hypothetical protein